MARTSDSNTAAHEAAVKHCASCMRDNSREPSALSNGVSPMASVGKAHCCPPAQSPETKLQIMPTEKKIVDEGIDDESIEVHRPNVVVVGRGPTKMLQLGMPSIEVGVRA